MEPGFIGIRRGQIGAVLGRRAFSAEAPGGGKGSLRALERAIESSINLYISQNSSHTFIRPGQQQLLEQ